MKKNIFTFVGEFSYELNWFIPWLRKLCKTSYSKDYNIFYGRPKMEKLYSDFISEYRVIPIEILNQLKYPCTVGEHTEVCNITFDVTPYILVRYISEQNIGCSLHLTPNFNTCENNPDGEYIHYTATDHTNSIILDFLNKISGKKDDTIIIVPKYRERIGRPEPQNWQKEKWIELTEKIINTFNYKVVSMLFQNKDSIGGSYDLNIKNKNYFTILNPSVDQQIALLQNTKYSIYGSTGANNLPFFCNTPMISFVLSQYGNRLFYDWQKKLTNNHKKQKIVLVDNMESYTSNQAFSELLDYEKNKIQYI